MWSLCGRENLAKVRPRYGESSALMAEAGSIGQMMLSRRDSRAWSSEHLSH